MSTDTSTGRKPRVVSLGRPEFVGEEYIEQFQKDFDYDVSHESSYSMPFSELCTPNLQFLC
jgi:hypothetical protein